MAAHETNHQKTADTISNEAIFKVTKEIVVKFIETSRVSPGNFADIFPAVYQVVLETITKPGGASARAGENAADRTKGL